MPLTTPFCLPIPAAPSLSLRFAVVARLLPRLLPVAPSLLVGIIVLAESAQALLLHGEELIRLRSRQTIPIPIPTIVIGIRSQYGVLVKRKGCVAMSL